MRHSAGSNPAPVTTHSDKDAGQNSKSYGMANLYKPKIKRHWVASKMTAGKDRHMIPAGPWWAGRKR